MDPFVWFNMCAVNTIDFGKRIQGLVVGLEAADDVVGVDGRRSHQARQDPPVHDGTVKQRAEEWHLRPPEICKQQIIFYI